MHKMTKFKNRDDQLDKRQGITNYTIKRNDKFGDQTESDREVLSREVETEPHQTTRELSATLVSLSQQVVHRLKPIGKARILGRWITSVL
ncbi:unnamed protein product [Nippostrongylus brasiliensis]|uniref:Transposase n=1 Tax=Nippostrongylus brasiliensis TaxID=27835 RepID=A0A0N4XIL5_NIPBR|nr:unnamed protein product [Nippostrongylus brasiliensis]